MCNLISHPLKYFLNSFITLLFHETTITIKQPRNSYHIFINIYSLYLKTNQIITALNYCNSAYTIYFSMSTWSIINILWLRNDNEWTYTLYLFCQSITFMIVLMKMETYESCIYNYIISLSVVTNWYHFHNNYLMSYWLVYCILRMIRKESCYTICMYTVL